MSALLRRGVVYWRLLYCDLYSLCADLPEQRSEPRGVRHYCGGAPVRGQTLSSSSEAVVLQQCCACDQGDMLAIRASRGSPQVGQKGNRGVVVAAWVHTTRNSSKIASQEAALSFSSPPSQSALVAPPCTPRLLSTGTVRSLHSAAHIVRRTGMVGARHGRVYNSHNVGRSRVSDVVRMTPIVRTLTSGAAPGIFGSWPSIRATARSELGGMGAMRRGMSTMSEREFHAVADEELEEIHDAVEEALEEGFEEDFDCNMAQGVLNIIVSDRGTWVINKQSPNQQIWWSSPISGPMRFEYDGGKKRWVNTRDGKTALRSILSAEMKEKCSVSLDHLVLPS